VVNQQRLRRRDRRTGSEVDKEFDDLLTKETKNAINIDALSSGNTSTCDSPKTAMEDDRSQALEWEGPSLSRSAEEVANAKTSDAVHISSGPSSRGTTSKIGRFRRKLTKLGSGIMSGAASQSSKTHSDDDDPPSPTSPMIPARRFGRSLFGSGTRSTATSSQMGSSHSDDEDPPTPTSPMSPMTKLSQRLSRLGTGGRMLGSSASPSSKLHSDQEYPSQPNTPKSHAMAKYRDDDEGGSLVPTGPKLSSAMMKLRTKVFALKALSSGPLLQD